MLCYIDPGAGSLVIQVIVAGILSTGIFLRHHVVSLWKWICSKFTGGSKGAVPGDGPKS